MKRSNHREPRQHRFATPTQEERTPVREQDYRLYEDKEPELGDLWRKASVYERAAVVLAIIVAALFSWYVAKSVP